MYRSVCTHVSLYCLLVLMSRLVRQSTKEDCKGNVSWCFCFMKRNELSLRIRTIISQKMFEEYEQKIMA